MFLKKYESLMIPCQTFIPDISVNSKRNLAELANFRSDYGKMLTSILEIYNEFMYELLPHLMIWRDQNIHHINKNIKFYTQDLIESPKVRFIYLKLTLIPHSSGTHANLILFDKKTKEMVRFEPYGFIDVLDEKELNETLKTLGEELFGKDIKYIKPSDYAKDYRFQVVSDDGNDDNKKMGDPTGYCLAWCFWFIELRLKNPDEPLEQLINNAFDGINKKDDSDTSAIFLDYIRNLSLIHI